MKVSEVIDRIKLIDVIMDKIERHERLDIGSTTMEDVFDMLGYYKDELLNKVVK